ncbi:MAG TPA: purine-nucleoside phosphorylase [Acidimicrobiales bacterium]|nr:purine-nucleoside phosphorylase [Acidimicrobiales bacterium]
MVEPPGADPAAAGSGGAAEVEPFALARAAAEELARRSGRARHDAAIVLGSGWQEAVEGLGTDPVEVPAAELPGFAAPSVPGHHGVLRSVELSGRHLLLCIGRTHLYEGRSPAEVVHPVRTAIFAGVSTVVLTNAAGGIRPEYRPGQAVLIADHLNLTGTSPLGGAPPPGGLPSRFVDLSAVYAPSLRALARQADESVEQESRDAGTPPLAPGADLAPGMGLAEGVYAGLGGPHYETPAEIRMLARLGADLVGMSTVLEAIAARHLGAQVLGISLVTNLAAGVTHAPLDHEEVLAAGKAAAPALGRLLAAVAARLPFSQP